MTGNLILFQAAVFLFLGGAVLGLASGRGRLARHLTFLPAIGGSALAVALALGVISGGKVSLDLQGLVPFFNLDFVVDGISAFFMLIIGAVSLAVSVYSLGYLREYQHKGRMQSFGFLFNIFILSMILVVCSNNGFFFLVFWELMSLVSFFLVIYNHEEEENIRSGMTYLVMTHLGTAFIVASFLTGYIQTGTLGLGLGGGASTAIPPVTRDLVFVFALVGFGTKAGLVPLHVWLPKAHPSAPSNVSALMSAVMVKMGIYGLVRTVSDISGASPDLAWWGMLMVGVGSASALVGVLYAVVERDIKRILAYSTIENVGIIVAGLGLSVVFSSYHLPSLSALALAASMFHALNHALFKGLLFMGAGSVVSVSHTRDIDKMGGLIRKMPWTSLLFLVGAVSISGLPPSNGFASEWLLLQSVLASSQISSAIIQISVAFASIPIALTIGLAAAAFVRLFAMTFLSRPRSTLPAIGEVSRTMVAGMAILACCCIILGVFPQLGVSLVSDAFHLQHMPSSQIGAISLPHPGKGNFASLSMPVVAVMLALLGFLAFGLVRVLWGRKAVRASGTWDCGSGSLDERTEYTATSLSQPIRAVFKALFMSHNETRREMYMQTNPYLVKSSAFTSSTRNIFEENLYGPVVSATISVLDRVRRLQTGKINSYLLYIMITIILLLLFVRLGHD